MKPNLTKFPKTDYNYTAVALNGVNGSCANRVVNVRSFRHISDDYFKHEAPQSFASESAFFVVIVMTVASALLSNANALHHLARAIGAV